MTSRSITLYKLLKVALRSLLRGLVALVIFVLPSGLTLATTLVAQTEVSFSVGNTDHSIKPKVEYKSQSNNENSLPIKTFKLTDDNAALDQELSNLTDYQIIFDHLSAWQPQYKLVDLISRVAIKIEKDTCREISKPIMCTVSTKTKVLYTRLTPANPKTDQKSFQISISSNDNTNYDFYINDLSKKIDHDLSKDQILTTAEIFPNLLYEFQNPGAIDKDNQPLDIEITCDSDYLTSQILNEESSSKLIEIASTENVFNPATEKRELGYVSTATNIDIIKMSSRSIGFKSGAFDEKQRKFQYSLFSNEDFRLHPKNWLYKDSRGEICKNTISFDSGKTHQFNLEDIKSNNTYYLQTSFANVTKENFEDFIKYADYSTKVYNRYTYSSRNRLSINYLIFLNVFKIVDSVKFNSSEILFNENYAQVRK